MEIGWWSSRACAPTVKWRVDAIRFGLGELTERQSGAGSEVTTGLDGVMPELFGNDAQPPPRKDMAPFVAEFKPRSETSIPRAVRRPKRDR
jgi:hypothetical protein